VGEHAYWQLAEVYRALCLYANCFQPSMKLVTKQIVDGQCKIGKMMYHVPLLHNIAFWKMFASLYLKTISLVKK
jgi:hypothetical protein